MPLALVRVDDRLIHGQVVEGWLPVIQAQRIVVVSDRAVEDELQKGLMRLAVPEEVALDVVSVPAAAPNLNGWAKAPERVMVLVPGVAELVRLLEAGALIREVNLGGIHDAPGRVMAAPHLWLTPEERARIAALAAGGLAIETRALPADPRRSWDELGKS
jgi:mannose/fructose/N-acetylgalactosamine-specific phosphotransferase system component IIB